MRKMTAVAVAVGICLIILIIGGLPQLSHASEIYGCVLKGGYGLLRIVSNPSQCNRSETAISWNQVGPQGPKGDTGAAGTAGANGHSPTVSMSGDQITVDGVITGSHLTGPAGPTGPSGTGSGVDGLSSVIMGRVYPDGTFEGSGFTVAKQPGQNGVYHIVLPSALNTVPTCVCSIFYLDNHSENPNDFPLYCAITPQSLYGGPPIDAIDVALTNLYTSYTGYELTFDGSFNFICAVP